MNLLLTVLGLVTQVYLNLCDTIIFEQENLAWKGTAH